VLVSFVGGAWLFREHVTASRLLPLGGILLGFPDDVAAVTDAVLGARVVSPSELESLRTGNWDVLAAEALAAA